ncbi:MAG TPA: nuclear transport factor 2 family protein [Pyrinomonadaceae bacterium]|jgi:ketosteroid isomerase-like protein|nr:nuclear transport factor 2 family protein [Pyrinomonadaceae bacterium]
MSNSTNNAAETAAVILKLERDIMDAIRNKNTTALAPLLADGFTYRTHFGAAANKAEFLQSIASFPMNILSIHGEELNVDVYGETAILTGVQRAEARAPEGPPEESAVAFTDVFVQTEGSWLMVLAYGVELPSEAGDAADRTLQ